MKIFDLTSFKFQSFFLFLFLLILGCDRQEGLERQEIIKPGIVDAKTTFQNLITSSALESISNLEGHAETMRGYVAYLRFSADEEAVKQIIDENNFEPCSYSGSGDNKPIPASYAKLRLQSEPKFNPAWNPGLVNDPQCYYRDEIHNNWTHSGLHFLIIDSTNDIVYFFAVGS